MDNFYFLYCVFKSVRNHYPIIQNVKLHFEYLLNCSGCYNCDTKLVRIDKNGVENNLEGLPYWTFVILHEIGHAVQDAKGYFPKRVNTAYQTGGNTYDKVEVCTDKWAREWFDSLSPLLGFSDELVRYSLERYFSRRPIYNPTKRKYRTRGLKLKGFVL